MNKNENVDLYKIIDSTLGPFSSQSEIKRRYIDHYNDLLQSLKQINDPFSESIVKRKILSLEKIYQILSDEGKRKKYDLNLMENLKSKRINDLERGIDQYLVLDILKLYEKLKDYSNNLNVKSDTDRIDAILKIDSIKNDLFNFESEIENIFPSSDTFFVNPKPGDEYSEDLHNIVNIERSRFVGQGHKEVTFVRRKGLVHYGVVLKKADVEVREVKAPSFNFKRESLPYEEIDQFYDSVTKEIEFGQSYANDAHNDFLNYNSNLGNDNFNNTKNNNQSSTLNESKNNLDNQNQTLNKPVNNDSNIFANNAANNFNPNDNNLNKPDLDSNEVFSNFKTNEVEDIIKSNKSDSFKSTPSTSTSLVPASGTQEVTLEEILDDKNAYKRATKKELKTILKEIK